MKKLETVFGCLSVVFGFMFAALCVYWYLKNGDPIIVPFGVVSLCGALLLGHELIKGDK